MGVGCNGAACLNQLYWISDGSNLTNEHSAKVSCDKVLVEFCECTTDSSTEAKLFTMTLQLIGFYSLTQILNI